MQPLGRVTTIVQYGIRVAQHQGSRPLYHLMQKQADAPSSKHPKAFHLIKGQEMEELLLQMEKARLNGVIPSQSGTSDGATPVTSSWYKLL